MEFNYKDTAKDIGWDFSKIHYIVEQDNPYYYYHKVIEHIKSDTEMLDIGCGSGEKSIRYFSNAKKIVMLDNEPEMLNKAKANVDKYYISKTKLKYEFMLGDADNKLDFPDESFDLVVSRHCGANMKEIYRVLKKGGVFISEDVDDEDCKEIKDYYKRGQNYNLGCESKEKLFIRCLKAGFSSINLLSFSQREYYEDSEQLKFLLKRTPIINGFNDESDNDILYKYCQDFKTSKGILLNRKLFAFELIK